MKRCPRCGTVKPRSDFYKDGTSAYCKPCTKADVAAWQKRNPGQFRQTQRRSVLKCRYGLTEDDLERMLIAQGRKCPICRTALDESNLNVDHDHATGRVRGVLCARCNRTIGLMRDDPAVIRSAVTYLTRRRDPREALL